MTTTTQMVLAELLDNPGTPLFGGEITRRTALRSGTLYPILQRLENAGWLSSSWEDAAVAADEGRPPRRYYQLTGTGETHARAQIRTPSGVLDRLLRADRTAPGAST